jgi:predicted PurR-regulated permease PerM
VEAAAQRALVGQALANDWLAQRGMPVQVDIASNLSLDSLVRQVRIDLDAVALSPLPLLSGAAGVLGSMAMILLLSVFFLASGRQLAEQVAQAFGGRATADVRFVLTTVHDTFAGFIRAQLVQSAAYAAGVWACLALAQVDSAPLVAATAGVLLLAPVLGAVLALLPPVLATLVSHPEATLVVVTALVVLEQLVLNVLGPRVMSRQLGLPPLLVLFGVLAGAQVGGLWGAVFGVPVLAVLVRCGQHFRPGSTD